MCFASDELIVMQRCYLMLEFVQLQPSNRCMPILWFDIAFTEVKDVWFLERANLASRVMCTVGLQTGIQSRYVTGNVS